jgi:hypothetical protein
MSHLSTQQIHVPPRLLVMLSVDYQLDGPLFPLPVSKHKFPYGLYDVRINYNFFLLVQSLSNPNIALLQNTTQQTIYAFIYFTNLDACSSASTMPDQINYTLRMQEYVSYISNDFVPFNFF